MGLRPSTVSSSRFRGKRLISETFVLVVVALLVGQVSPCLSVAILVWAGSLWVREYSR